MSGPQRYGDHLAGPVDESLFLVPFTLALCHLDRADKIETLVQNKLHALTRFSNANFLLVDNGSIDNSPEIFRRLEQSEPRFHWVIEPRRGIYYARRRAILSAHGDFIIMVDDDVMLSEQDLVGLITPILADPKVGLVGGLVELDWQVPQPTWLTDKLLNQFRTDIPISPHVAYSDACFPCLPTGVAKAVRLGPCTDLFCAELRASNYPLGRRRADPVHQIAQQDLGGEDIDLAEIFAENGYRVLFANQVRVKLEVPEQRLEPEWFLGRFLADGRTRIRLLKYSGRPILGRHGIRFILGLPVLCALGIFWPFLSGRLRFLWRCYVYKAWGAWIEWLSDGPAHPWPYRLNHDGKSD